MIHTYHGHVLRGYFGPVQTAVFRRLEQILARFTDRLVAVSPRVKQDLVDLGIAASDRFRVVHFSVQQDHLHLIVEGDERVVLQNGNRALAIRIAGHRSESVRLPVDA